MIGIYKIISPSGKVYVGQSINIESRIKKYASCNCKLQVRLYSSIKKYGWENHIFEILEECSIEELNSRERYWQDQYECIGKNGLNCFEVRADMYSVQECLNWHLAQSHSHSGSNTAK